MTSRWLWILVAACSTEAAPPPAASPPASPGTPLPRAVGIPHSGEITLVAVTEQGDAAFTTDTHHQARIWPALDGSREPVVVPLQPVSDIALVRTADGLLAAVIDGAGGLELIRLDADGKVRGRSRIAPDPGFDELDALGDGMIALRRDQVLVRFDARGEERGTLAARTGEHVRSIATRAGRALVGLDGAEPTEPPSGPGALLEPQAPSIAHVRVVDTSAGLVWGDRHDLDEPLVPDSLAVSPSGSRIAGLLAREGQPVIADTPAAAMTHVVPEAERFPLGTFVGFLDDKTALFSSGSLIRWWGSRPDDPWETPNLDVQGNAGTIGVANGSVVGAAMTGLRIIDTRKTLYLGYRQIATHPVKATGNVAAIASPHRITWLDRDLVERGSLPISTKVYGGSEVTPIGPQQFIQVNRTSNDRSQDVVFLHGPPHQPPLLLGSWSNVRMVVYDPTSRVLAIPWRYPDAGSQPTTIERFEVDLERMTVRKLRPLSTRAVVNRVVPLDPAHADGLIAVATGRWADQATVIRFGTDLLPDDDSTREAGKVHASKSDAGSFGSDLIELGVDRAGTAYFMHSRIGLHAIQIVPARGPRTDVSIPTTDSAFHVVGGAVSHDGKMVSVYGNHLVAAFDLAGVEQWRHPWDATSVQFLADDRTVVVGSPTGAYAVDRATGRKLGTACAFGFELSPTPVDLATFTQENACSIDD